MGERERGNEGLRGSERLYTEEERGLDQVFVDKGRRVGVVTGWRLSGTARHHPMPCHGASE